MAMSRMSNSSNMTFRFMDLPAELRLIVYTELLVDHGGVVNLAPYSGLESFRCAFEPSILRVCKTIYHEALPILYKTNTFLICSYRLRRGVKMNFAGIGAARIHIALIRRVLCEARGVIMKEEIMRAYRAIGLQWDSLHLFGILLGSSCTKTLSVEPGGEHDWLVEVKPGSEKQILGLDEGNLHRAGPWYVRKDDVHLSQRETTAVDCALSYNGAK